MKKVCAMAGTIFNPEKPGQSIRELKTVGIQGIMFDYGIFASAEWILQNEEQKDSKWKPERTVEYYDKVMAAFAEYDFLPSVARLPFTKPQVRLKDSRQYAKLNSLILRINKDCIRACEKIGCEMIIVQPLSVGVEREKEWETNKAFYLELAAWCERAETKLLLINQCRNLNGHLVRGICSDGEMAAEWIDALNRETAKRSRAPEDASISDGVSVSERFGFCLDIGNCNLCGQNMQGMAEALGKRIKAVILTENDGQKNAKLLPFTSAYGKKSTLDWLGIIRGLRETAFDGYLILETVDTTVSFSPLLQPYLFPVYKALLDYFEMQIAIERDLKKYEHIVLFGAGNMCRNYMKCYGKKYPPLFTCDNNPRLWGTEFEGLEIKAPETLKKLPENSGVIICNIFYREIEAQLHSMGIENIGYFNDEYMPSFYFDRLKREEDFEEESEKETLDAEEKKSHGKGK